MFHGLLVTCFINPMHVSLFACLWMRCPRNKNQTYAKASAFRHAHWSWNGFDFPRSAVTNKHTRIRLASHETCGCWFIAFHK